MGSAAAACCMGAVAAACPGTCEKGGQGLAEFKVLGRDGRALLLCKGSSEQHGRWVSHGISNCCTPLQLPLLCDQTTPCRLTSHCLSAATRYSPTGWGQAQQLCSNHSPLSHLALSASCDSPEPSRVGYCATKLAASRRLPCVSRARTSRRRLTCRGGEAQQQVSQSR